jgi:hypothetical protein
MFLICLIYVYVSITYQYLCASIYKKIVSLKWFLYLFLFSRQATELAEKKTTQVESLAVSFIYTEVGIKQQPANQSLYWEPFFVFQMDWRYLL